MKKLLALVLSVLCMFSCVSLFGCNKRTNAYTFYVPDGAPALSIAKFIYDNENFGEEVGFSYNVVSSTAISGAITVNNADFVIMPINSATKLYKSGKKPYVLCAVITHGNFYFMAKADISSLSDLIGKVVYVPNKGKVPDWTLLSALKSAQIEYAESNEVINGKVAISYLNEGKDVMQKLVSGDYIGLLPEPVASVVENKKIGYNKCSLNLQNAYDSENNSYPQAVLMVKKSIAQNNPEVIYNIAGSFASNVEWTKNNPSLAVNAIKGIFAGTTLTDTLSKNAVVGCNIYYQGANDAKQQVNDYLDKITKVDLSSAVKVDDDFYM